jgi:hypothetical protein
MSATTRLCAEGDARIEQRLETIRQAIVAAEEKLRHVWFEVTWQGLAWRRRDDGKPFAIFFNDKPLAECSLETRLENFKKLPELVSNAHRQADAKLKEHGL